MAVKIIDVGPDPSAVKRTVCHNCGAVLEYTMRDTRRETISDYGGGSDTYVRIDCPNCQQVLDV
jgi:RNase P subunit RPR2